MWFEQIGSIFVPTMHFTLTHSINIAAQNRTCIVPATLTYPWLLSYTSLNGEPFDQIKAELLTTLQDINIVSVDHAGGGTVLGSTVKLTVNSAQLSMLMLCRVLPLSYRSHRLHIHGRHGWNPPDIRHPCNV